MTDHPKRKTKSFRVTPHGRIEVKLRELSQLFNSMDPSPFHEKDLDNNAVDFIVAWALEHPRHLPLELIIHLTQKPSDPDPQKLIKSAVHYFFAHKAELTWRNLKQMLRQGRTSLLIGLLFLVSCTLISELSLKLPSTHVQSFLRESLTIAGWVAMWSPMQTFLYDWWPLRNRIKIYQKLSRMTVQVRSPD